MMDKQTKRTLSRITMGIPDRLLDVTRVEVDDSEEELARAALASPEISMKKKREIKKLLDKGAFRREETVIDEEKVAALDRYHTRAIKKAKAAGMLSDPNNDIWYKKRMKKIRDKESGKK